MHSIDKNDLAIIQSLVGNVNSDQLRNIEFAVTDGFGIFVPAVGPCYYSVSPAHSHPAYMVIYNLYAQCDIKIGSKVYTPPPFSVSVYSPGLKHQELINETFNRYYAIMIDPELFEKAAKKITDSIPFFDGQYFEPNDNYIFYIREFISEHFQNTSASKTQLPVLATRITHLTVSGLLNPIENPEINYAHPDINSAIEFMYQNFCENIDIDSIADSCHYSSSHFSRLFKSETGQSPAHFLKNIRLKKARQLLVSSDRSITDIAFLSGFNSSAYFTAAFAQRFGIAPSQVRKKNGETVYED
ncbi:MAG: AraC family transcriptional regulator [Spirochaetes bacterium]|jgi:AraC family transcriptional regulator|nr:AraC family transcriptional regulator [Spirochaetota bacterium]